MQDDDAPPAILQEDVDDGPELRNIPEAEDNGSRKDAAADENEPLFVSSSDDEFFATQRPPSKRQKRARKDEMPFQRAEEEDDAQDDKKKLALTTSYDGFSIYGRILCLVVKRKGNRTQSHLAPSGGSQMMEQWVSTQAAQEAGLDQDDEG